MKAQRLVVLAWGNESRGDDGLGPAFLAHAQALPDPPGVVTTFVTDFQLQPEHAVDLVDQDLVLFVDADARIDAALALREVAPARSTTFTTHGLAPAAVLDAYRLTYAAPAPPAFLLAIGAESFALGATLGARARRNLAAALALFDLLRRRPHAKAWRRIAENEIGPQAHSTEEQACASPPR